MIRRVTFEVDQGKLFDMLALTGDWGPIGTRVIGALLANGTSCLEAIGMAVYGIVLVPEQPAQGTSKDIRNAGHSHLTPVDLFPVVENAADRRRRSGQPAQGSAGSEGDAP